jgi:hypothetical protein
MFVSPYHTSPPFGSGVFQARRRHDMDVREEKGAAGKGLLLWLVGVPLPVILVLWMLGFLGN